MAYDWEEVCGRWDDITERLLNDAPSGDAFESAVKSEQEFWVLFQEERDHWIKVSENWRQEYDKSQKQLEELYEKLEGS